MKNQKGFIGGLIVFVLFLAFFFTLLFVSFSAHREVVSGIVYNTSYDHALTGNTTFSVRAAADTLVTEENQSSYCLPPNSPYLPLVKKAAEDKNVKVVVTTDKYFTVKAPWTCYPNVKVTEVK